MEKYYWKILYDAECSMCSNFAKYLKKFDINEIFNMISLQEYCREQDTYTYDELMKEIHLLGKCGEIFKGGAAVNQILVEIPQLKPFRWMLNNSFSKKTVAMAYSGLDYFRRCKNCGRRR